MMHLYGLHKGVKYRLANIKTKANENLGHPARVTFYRSGTSSRLTFDTGCQQMNFLRAIRRRGHLFLTTTVFAK